MLILVDHACHSSEEVVSRLGGPGSLVEDSSNFSQGQEATWFIKQMAESDMRTSSWFRRALTIGVRRPSVATREQFLHPHWRVTCQALSSTVSKKQSDPPKTTKFNFRSKWKPSRFAWPISSDFWAHCCVNILVGHDHEFHFSDWVLISLSIQYVSVIAWVFDFRKFITTCITDVSLQAMYIACAPIASLCSEDGFIHERRTKYLVPWI